MKMKASHYNLKKLIVLGSASVFTLLAVPLMSDLAFENSGLVTSAQAAESGQGGKGGESGNGGSGEQGAKKKGQGSSHETSSGGASKAVEGVVTEEEGGKGKMGSTVGGQGKKQDNKMSGSGKGAPGEDSDAKGPRHSGGTGTGSGGGKPAWSNSGIPEVELGRLNVARSPAKVLDKSLVTALATLNTLNSTTDSLYEAPTLDAAIAMLAASTTRIDSPLENLAMLKDLLADGKVGTFDPVMPDADFAALLLGSAADKTVPITADTVKAMSVILKVTFPAPDAAIATSADLVRSTINTAHGE